MRVKELLELANGRVIAESAYDGRVKLGVCPVCRETLEFPARECPTCKRSIKW